VNKPEQSTQSPQPHKFQIHFCFRNLFLLGLPVIVSTFLVNNSLCAEQLSVKIGSYENQPKIFSDQNSTISGFWPKLLEYIAEKENWKIEYIHGTWSEGLTRLEKEEIDIMPDVAFTEERTKLYTFSKDPVLMSWSRLYLHRDDTSILSIQDLSNKKIAALKNSVNLEGENGFREILQGFNIDCTLIELDNYKEVFRAITEGMADGGITNRNFGNKNEKNYAVKKTPIIFQPINMKFAFPRDSANTPYIAERIDFHMTELLADDNSLYYQLLKKYFESEIAEKRVEIFPDYLKTLLKILILLLIIFLCTIIATRLQVKRKTQKIRKINKDLMRSEEKYRILTDQSPDLRYRTNMEGKVVYISEAVYRLSGYTVKEAIGMSMADTYVNPEDRESLLSALQQNGHVNSFTVQVKRKDGSTWWASSSAQYHKDSNGNIIGIDGIARNITEQKEAETALRKSEEQWHRTFNSFPDIVTLQDIDFHILKANQAACTILEISCDEIVDQSCYSLFHGSSEPCQDCPLLETQKDFTSYSREMHHAKLGKTFLVSAAPVLDEQGEIEYIVHVANDITDIKESELERLRLASAIEQAAETVVITDASGSIQYVNPAFEKLTGYSSAEALGQNPRILKSGEHDLEFYKDMWATLVSGKTWQGHFINRKKDGSLFEEEASISPVKNSDGKTTNYVAVKRDVSREVALEHQLRQSIKMEAVGTMASGIAHDFNNILSGIIGCAEFIQEEASPESPIGQNIGDILVAGNRATDLVRQILSFSRQEASKKEIISPYPVVKEAVNLLRATLPATATIQENISPGCGNILADPITIHQIVVNLCTNSLHALPEQKGTLVVTLEHRDLAPERGTHSGPFVVISVKDSGCGMEQRTIDRIFEPYFTTKEVGRGTGLGLAIVHGTVKEYQGFIEVESQIGEGTVISVFLPETMESSTQRAVMPTQRDREKLTPAAARILVVDDEALLVKINKRRLESIGYQVTAVTDSNEALEIFSKHPDAFDLLITDQTMPKLTGAELAKAMLTIRPSLPIIMCTGHSDIVSEAEAIATGIRRYVFKPLHGNELLDAVQDVLAEGVE